MLIKDIENKICTSNDIYIYGYGTAGRWILDNLNLENNFKGFIDTDQKKSGLNSSGHMIYYPEQIKKLLNHNSIIINTVIDIQDVLDIFKDIEIKENIPLGLYLDEFDISNSINNSDVSEEFLEYSLDAVKSCHQGYFLSNGKVYLRSIDVVITEKCSLKCKDCSNLMQYYEKPEDISYEKIVLDFDKLTKIGRAHV